MPRPASACRGRAARIASLARRPACHHSRLFGVLRSGTASKRPELTGLAPPENLAPRAGSNGNNKPPGNRGTVSMSIGYCVRRVVVAGACALWAHAAAAQDAVEQFYKGKQINIVVGSSAGGGYDTYARLLARYFG